ncbi:tRNA preQ1(34) S-adenosylmethionine ribosyltransferase-isomerase QueA [Patescibacteria group bacterium]|nr:tRNA preQ1(34) S-adenosylmethionine ribosyltransferase-isomerase QueA [Patescibacteria group bacterium]MCL5091528.1 tRNA preQ1(34) S-adenosylmethionine ribosyltransferase-isomerase QueA [Patescibacteria group bacterium]
MKPYYYDLPSELIAKQPAVPRDHSRLLVYDTKSNSVELDYFYHLGRYLPKPSFLVMNNTKVVPARVEMRKTSGGKAKALFLINEVIGDRLPVTREKANTVRAMVDRKIKIGDRLFFDQRYFMTVIDQQEHIFTLRFDFSVGELFSVLEDKGTMPIPLYIKNTPLSQVELKQKYQTIFAQKEGSAAAPTASLHFTNRLLSKLDREGIKRHYLTLHVGLGTFAPVTEQNLKQKKLHEEWYEVPVSTFQLINQLKNEGKELVAVGTTVVRTLESVVINHRPSWDQLRSAKSSVKSVIGKTDLFIFPPYRFQMIDALITNFHLPGSSLMMLVEAFLQHKHSRRHLIDLYRIAVGEKFRLYSFGDAMLIK